MSAKSSDDFSTNAHGGLAAVSVTTTASPERVWSVLADGWSYAGWVVGASRIRRVDGPWPALGSRVHHSVGSWPLLLNDETEVLECDPSRRLVLQARGRPFGEARVSLVLEPKDDGCTVSILEDATHGPGRLIPKPLRQLAIVPRNRESLRRLAYLAERDGR